MKVCPISIVQPMQYNNKTKVNNENSQVVKMSQTQQPSFKGLKAGLFGTIGTIACGAIATFATGGAVLPVLLAGSAGTYFGCLYGKSKEGKSGNNDDDGYYGYKPYYNDKFDTIS